MVSMNTSDPVRQYGLVELSCVQRWAGKSAMQIAAQTYDTQSILGEHYFS